jgi:hypothetical protein
MERKAMDSAMSLKEMKVIWSLNEAMAPAPEDRKRPESVSKSNPKEVSQELAVQKVGH